jgi:predicted RNA methylase
VILLLKAKISGGAVSDLLAIPVPVSGYTTEDGTYVAPHIGLRHKKVAAPAAAPAASAQPDLFSVPAPKTIDEKLEAQAARRDPDGIEAAKKAPEVPERVMAALRGSIAMLAEVKEMLEKGRVADQHFGGAGRYETETLANRASDIASAENTIALFRKHAKQEGVDPEAVIAELGGVPDISLSEVGQRYLDDSAKPIEADHGKVEIAPGLEEACPGFTAAAEELHRTLFPELRVTVRMTADKALPAGHINSPHTLTGYGLTEQVKPKSATSDLVIDVNRHGALGQERPAESMADTLLHEFGHAFQIARYYGEPEDVRKPIIDQWAADLRGPNDIRYDAADLARIKKMILAWPDENERMDDPEHVGQVVRGDNRYFAVFEEWFAERFATWAAAKTPDESPIGKFFGGAIATLRLAFRRAAQVLGIPLPAAGAFERFADAAWQAGQPSAESQITQWGMPAGASKADRRAANAAAVALLAAKTDQEMTDADRAVLARYTGRAGIGDSLNEFYTEPAVASAMWSMLGAAGFQGGDVLEPSSGTGVYLHTAPAGTRVTAVELDPTSARIAGIIHRPAGHEVNNASLERFATQDGRQFDAVIGNVPFGLRGGLIKDDKPDLSTADQYFVDTALDKAKDGGLVALIVPTGIMDSKPGRAFRERVLRKGEFLGAHRLPNTAFEASHTGVTSDILMFRKRPQDIAGALSTLTQDQVKEAGVWDADYLSGGYFSDGRGAPNVMGRMEDGWRAKAGMGHDITVTGSMNGVPEALASWAPATAEHNSPSMERILEVIGPDAPARQRAINAALKPPYQVAKLGDIRIIGGVRYVLQGDPPRWHRAEGEVPDAVKDIGRIGQMVDDLAEGRAKDPRFVRGALIEALDDYVKLHGLPARNRDLLRWMAAPSLPQQDGDDQESHQARVDRTKRHAARLLGAVSDDGTYSDLVTGAERKGEAADIDTVATKLSLEAGGFTVDQLVATGHGTAESVLDHLYASPGYALEADGRTWTTMDTYLSGELWPKYDAAVGMAAHEGVTPETQAKYALQVKMLEETIQPKSLEDVEVALNSGFITPEVISAWFESKREAYLDTNPSGYGPGSVTVKLEGGLWTFQVDKGTYSYMPSGVNLLDKYLNRTGLRKDDQPTIDQMNTEFGDWIRSGPYREQVEEAYNRSHRGFRQREYSDAAISIPGLNPALDVNAYHFAGLRWAMEAGTGIIAADVGLGKTGRALMLARLAKVTGEATKPTIVVPKSVLANWLAETQFWFPGSKVLAIGETYSIDKNGRTVSKQDDAATRTRKFNDLQQNDYDFVLISQPAWNELDVDPITKGDYANADFWAQRGDRLGNAGDKRLNQIRTAYDQAKAKREFGTRDETIYFNQTGIDMLILDEGHAFKNLYSAKDRFGESPKFLGGSGESNRAQDTFYKTKWLREQRAGKGVFMLTATPTKNSPLEVYSMLSHIAPQAFERMGIRNSEEFLDRFCEFKQDTILTVDGKLKEALITAGFKNLDELREVMRRYIDRKTAADVGLKLPVAQPHQHLIDMTDKQELVYQELRAAAAATGTGDADGDAHIFSIMSRMGKASIDLGLLGYKNARSPKIDACAKVAAAGVEDGGQVIFCEHVDVHDKIVAALVAAGIPREQIGVINGQAAASSAARQRISDDFNAGKLKAVVGNKTMEEGINLQKGTTDIHHLDLPWEPSSLQQRNGRGLRQGNKKEAVRIHTYLAKRSFDGYRFQTIQAKRDWQDLLWNGGARVENLAREGAFSREDMMIMLSANPEEARAKYNADKDAAVVRAEAEKRAEAVATYRSLLRMKASLVQRGKAGITDASQAALEQRVAQRTDALRLNAAFPHKHLLDSDKPAVIEPVTGTAWQHSMGLELTPGPAAPVKWGTEPSKWVVSSVSPESSAIFVRPYGGDGKYGTTISLNTTELQSGVTPFSYSAEDEAQAIVERTEKLKAAAGAEAQAKAMKAVKPADLKAMPAAVIDRAAPQLQQQIKDAVRAYRTSFHSPVGMVNAAGEPVVVASYSVRDKLDDHDLILPTTAGRAAAIKGYVKQALSRKVSTRYKTGRRGAYTGQAVGIEASYPEGGYGNTRNPWEGTLSDLFGAEGVAEAEKQVRDHVIGQVADAPTFRAAVSKAAPAVDIGYGGPKWPKPVIAALRTRAEALGVMDEHMSTAAPSTGPDAVHSGLTAYESGQSASYRPPTYTVRQFLERREKGL